MLIGNSLFQLSNNLIEVKCLSRKEMFETTCTECGGTAKVPFKPTPGKPVYCTDCFNKNRSRRDENRQVSVNPRNVWARRRPDGQKEKEREYVPVAFNTL